MGNSAIAPIAHSISRVVRSMLIPNGWDLVMQNEFMSNDAIWRLNGTVRPAFAIPLGRTSLQRLGELVLVQGQIDSLLHDISDLLNMPPWDNHRARSSEANYRLPHRLTLGPKLDAWIAQFRDRRPCSGELAFAEAIYLEAKLFASTLRNPLLHGHFGTATGAGFTTTTAQRRPVGRHPAVAHSGQVRNAVKLIKEALAAGCLVSLKLATLHHRV